MSEKKENKHIELMKIDVNEHTEKKNGLTYLSWAWAWAEAIKADPDANYEFLPHQMFGNTMMVYCAVTLFGKTITAYLPVMNHSNKAIENPDAFMVNKAMMRCLTKGIGLHGLALYIYAGEDLPNKDDTGQEETPEYKKFKEKELLQLIEIWEIKLSEIIANGTAEEVFKWWASNKKDIIEEIGEKNAKAIHAKWNETQKSKTKESKLNINLGE